MKCIGTAVRSLPQGGEGLSSPWVGSRPMTTRNDICPAPTLKAPPSRGLLREIANRQNAQAGELLKRREIPVSGDKGYVMVETALGD